MGCESKIVRVVDKNNFDVRNLQRQFDSNKQKNGMELHTPFVDMFFYVTNAAATAVAKAQTYGVNCWR